MLLPTIQAWQGCKALHPQARAFSVLAKAALQPRGTHVAHVYLHQSRFGHNERAVRVTIKGYKLHTVRDTHSELMCRLGEGKGKQVLLHTTASGLYGAVSSSKAAARPDCSVPSVCFIQLSRYSQPFSSAAAQKPRKTLIGYVIRPPARR